VHRTRARQLELFDRGLPGHIVVVKTSDLDLTTDAGIETCVRRMFAVPLDKSMLLEFLKGYKRGDPHASEEHLELHRMQALLNHRMHSQRFDYLGDGLIPRMFRRSFGHVKALCADLDQKKAERDMEIPLNGR
jgi:hypothetical protein